MVDGYRFFFQLPQLLCSVLFFFLFVLDPTGVQLCRNPPVLFEAWGLGNGIAVVELLIELLERN
jgi:hypothetical protein